MRTTGCNSGRGELPWGCNLPTGVKWSETAYSVNDSFQYVQRTYWVLNNYIYAKYLQVVKRSSLL